MEVVTQVLAGTVVVGLLALVVWLLRRSGSLKIGLARRKRGSGRLLESLERLPLSPQHTLHLVRVENRTVLVAIHSGGCSVLETNPTLPKGIDHEGRPAAGDAR